MIIYNVRFPWEIERGMGLFVVIWSSMQLGLMLGGDFISTEFLIDEISKITEITEIPQNWNSSRRSRYYKNNLLRSELFRNVLS